MWLNTVRQEIEVLSVLDFGRAFPLKSFIAILLTFFFLIMSQILVNLLTAIFSEPG